MKRLIYNILLFVGILLILFFAYRNIFDGHALPIILSVSFLTLYGGAMALGEIGMQRLKKYEYKAVHKGLESEDSSKIYGAAILSLFPMFFCIGLASAFPIMVYEVWFITVFPCLIVSYFPIKEVFDEYYSLTRKKAGFWITVFAVSAVLLVSCQCIVQLFI